MQFVDLKAQYNAYKEEIDQAMARVIGNTAFIKGPDVAALEEELAAFAGVKHALACSSGTDALLLPLMAWDVQPGDEILVPDFTFIATAEIPAFWKAKPVFVDIDPVTFNMDPADAETKITDKTVGIIPVSLYGQIADMKALQNLADNHGLWLMEDGAQSFGALHNGRRSGSFGQASTTSFFPAKPLGCYGDGGAVFTDDDNLAALMRRLLNHGQAKRYHHSEVGFNGRMDTLQCAITRVKLAHFEDELAARNKVAAAYTQRFQDLPKVSTPAVLAENTSSWAQYTLRIQGDGTSARRDKLREDLSAKGIPSAVHYPVPLHLQEAFRFLGVAEEACPHTRRACNEVISLPMHAFMTEAEIDQVADAVKDALK